MASILDRSEVDVSCPQCSRQIRIRLGDVRRGARVTCPAGHAVRLEESGNGMARIDRAFDDLRRTLARRR